MFCTISNLLNLIHIFIFHNIHLKAIDLNSSKYAYPYMLRFRDFTIFLFRTKNYSVRNNSQINTDITLHIGMRFALIVVINLILLELNGMFTVGNVPPRKQINFIGRSVSFICSIASQKISEFLYNMKKPILWKWLTILYHLGHRCRFYIVHILQHVIRRQSTN